MAGDTSVSRRARLTVTWPALTGAAASAGVGFTVSLLVATLAFEGRTLELATLGVLASAVLSPVLAWVAFRITGALPARVRPRQRRHGGHDRRPVARRRPRSATIFEAVRTRS
jgi:hypothetical protein